MIPFTTRELEIMGGLLTFYRGEQVTVAVPEPAELLELDRKLTVALERQRSRAFVNDRANRPT